MVIDNYWGIMDRAVSFVERWYNMREVLEERTKEMFVCG
jgi:hypothetical protein